CTPSVVWVLSPMASFLLLLQWTTTIWSLVLLCVLHPRPPAPLSIFGLTHKQHLGFALQAHRNKPEPKPIDDAPSVIVRVFGCMTDDHVYVVALLYAETP